MKIGEIKVKENLEVEEYLGFVSAIVESFFDMDDDGEQYRPDFATIYEPTIVATHCLTGIEFEGGFVGDGSKESDIIMPFVVQAREKGYYQKAVTDAIAMVNFRTAKLVNKSKYDDVMDSIMGLINAVKKQVDGIDSSMLQSLSKLGEQAGGISQEELATALAKVIGEDLDKQKDTSHSNIVPMTKVDDITS